METAIEAFVLYLEAERGYSIGTGKAYRSDLRQLCGHMCQAGSGGSVDDVDAAVVRSWMVAMKKRGLSNASVARHVHALRSFWHFLLDTDVVTHDPLRKISAPKYPRPLPQYLRIEELRALLDAAQNNRDFLVGVRNYAVMAVFIFAGLRRGELINLKLTDLKLDEKLVRVYGKGGKWRVVPLAEEACSALVDWLEFRPVTAKHDYVFTTVRGNRIHPTRMHRIWRTVLETSGIRREGVSLHTLRHSAATLLLQSGTLDLVQIQRLLGHSRLDTTAIYLHVEPSDLQKAMGNHPLSLGSPRAV